MALVRMSLTTSAVGYGLLGYKDFSQSLTLLRHIRLASARATVRLLTIEPQLAPCAIHLYIFLYSDAPAGSASPL